LVISIVILLSPNGPTNEPSISPALAVAAAGWSFAAAAVLLFPVEAVLSALKLQAETPRTTSNRTIYAFMT